MVSPGKEDATEDQQKAASALEVQALVGQELRPADQAHVLDKVGSAFSLSLKRRSSWHQNLDTHGWIGVRKHCGSGSQNSLYSPWASHF